MVYEGEETEVIYFDAISNNKSVLGINPLIELVPLMRNYGELGWSNPKKIVDRLIDNVEEAQSGTITYEILINRIMDYLIDEKIIVGKPLKNSTWKTLKWICEERLKRKMTDCVSDMNKECEEVWKLLQEETSIENVVNNIADIIAKSAITYTKGFDKICLIVDRDKDSFVVNESTNQYEYVLNACIKHEFGFYVTNPCFEFWLLLHFDDVHELDKNILLENPHITKKRRYTEIELKKRMRYTKNKYDADKLLQSLDIAVENEHNYCEDIVQLENNLGSNIGILIEEIRNN